MRRGSNAAYLTLVCAWPDGVGSCLFSPKLLSLLAARVPVPETPPWCSLETASLLCESRLGQQADGGRRQISRTSLAYGIQWTCW